ncbi:extracellular ligand-binding receptor [Caballeronia hypogeia]|uniref:Extracellular ligand-binding receptor n=1 Tax=Caballeronia hypogeia TaxID=1777140 RepID=A0A158D945_9BURK|nr:branched-chain amino acid ABC transporter substrate-binding protein [Caballeronia hypogeia]SAK91194.1 extracellular ligand-binding receptor [Caballeronia hypogeia]
MIRLNKVMAAVVCGAALVGYAHADDTVKIGVAGPLTGGLAQQGKDVENGARLAVEQINAAGIKIKGAPLHLEIISEDDRADPKTAVTVAQKLVDDGVVGVIGHLTSGTSLPASKVYSNAGIPEISPSATNPMLTRQGFQTAFRVIGDDAYVGRVVAQYMVKTAGYKNVAVIDDRSAYGQGLADIVVEELKKNGATVVDREFVTPNTLDFRGVLTSAKGKNPQAIFYGGTDSQSGPLRKQMTGLGMHIPLVSSAMATENFIQLAGAAAAEGSVSAESGAPLESMPGGKKFVEQFKKYGPVVLYSPYAYDAVWALAHAMEKANSADPKVFLPAMKKIDFEGVTGQIAFDDKGDLRKTAVTLYQVKGGHFQPMQTVR